MIVAVVPGVLHAAGRSVQEYLADWGNPVHTTCHMSVLGDATIGKNKDTCKGNYAIDKLSPDICKATYHDLGVLMLVAREITATGANFCVTTVRGGHKSKGNTWTDYTEPGGGSNVCQWLCKPGYGGARCAQSNYSDSCDSTLLKRSDFDEYSIGYDAGSIENIIPMFYWDNKRSCGEKNRQEHDMILAVSGWLDSGHGAWVAPFNVRARREGNKNQKSGIELLAATAPILVCKNGYTANTDNNDCVPIDATKCEASRMQSNLCSGWPAADFNDQNMEMVFDSTGNCYQYRCKEAGYAFASANVRACQKCEISRTVGISPTDGTCVKCANDKVFVAKENATSNNDLCVEAQAYSKTDLMYGKGKNKNNAKDVSKQCWTVFEPKEYKECVANGGVKKQN